MNDNERKPIPSTSSQKPTTSKTVKKPATVKHSKSTPSNPKPSTSKPLRSVTPEIDLDLEYDFAYSAYLRTIIKNQMMDEKIQTDISNFEDQLLQQLEVLQVLQFKQFQMENEIELLKSKQEVHRVYKALNEIYGQVMDMLEKFTVDQNVNKYGEEIKNMKPLKDYPEYKKLQTIIIKCNESIEKCQNLGCYPTEIQLLRDNIKEFHRLSKQFEITRQLIFKQHQVFKFQRF